VGLFLSDRSVLVHYGLTRNDSVLGEKKITIIHYPLKTHLDIEQAFGYS